ncbi:MAG: maleylpyruvate isomerase N-terminal domain-containing protein [Dehalococcoidia bacterium]
MADKAAAIHDLESGYQQFRKPLESLDDAAYTEVWLGEWDLSRLLAHMAGWYREMTGAIERAGRGERPTPEGVDYSKADDWNAGFARLAKPGKAALADFDDAFAVYVAAARALPDSMYGTDPEKGRPKIGNRLLEGAGIHHFKEHQPELTEWLAGRGK